ncbi:MAG TPA: type II toxin-antitoxin system VapC family toxin, partial [Anaerolineae bacterium]|nr:type II toxin-antitoxin system VapC family toxin [Anaerolineae bacterium]
MRIVNVSEGYVLDTSAIITLIESEPGAKRVKAVLRQETVWLPWIVLLETYYISRQERGEAEADFRYA